MLNIVGLTFQVQKMGAYNLDGTYSEANSAKLILDVLVGIIVIFPLLIAFFTAIIVLFTKKEVPYKKRFRRTFLFVLVIFYTIFLIRILMNIL